MKRIKINLNDKIKAFHVLLTKSPSRFDAFAGEEYVIEDSVLPILKKEGIKFEVLKWKLAKDFGETKP